jgi:phosphoribosylamine--glycine ligase
VRLGDPEAQVILPRMKENFLELCSNAVEGKLPNKIPLEKYALCVVMASEGYPEKPKKGLEVKIPEEIEKEFESGDEDFIIFHAGTKRENGKLITSGGRVLGVVGIGNSKDVARKNAYYVVEKISFEGAIYRKDIGELYK